MRATIYARKEPTTDAVYLQFAHGNNSKLDTVYYSDPAGTKRVARLPWHLSGHPRRNSKTAVVNCYRYSLGWIESTRK